MAANSSAKAQPLVDGPTELSNRSAASLSPDKSTAISFKLETGSTELLFSDGLNRAIAEVIPSKEPIDQPDWSATEYINAVFPDGTFVGGSFICSCGFDC